MWDGSTPDGPDDSSVPRFAHILLPEFPLYALILATEVLRSANQNTGRRLFETVLVSESGQPVRATNGWWTPVDCGLDTMPDADVVIVFGGNLPTQRVPALLLNRLRRSARHGCIIGAVDTGPFVLAAAGLLDGRRATVHWESLPAFRERYPDLEIADRLFVDDGTRLTCAGGVATLDMMLALIRRFRGPALAAEMANAFIHRPRDAGMTQRPAEEAASLGNAKAMQMVRLMEDNLEMPLTIGELAAALGVSTRTLERLARRSFGESPQRVYLNLRLQAARNLLFYDDLSVRDVGLASGFGDGAVFCRAFHRVFGQSPSTFRSSLRRAQNETVRPELRRLTPDVPARADQGVG